MAWNVLRAMTIPAMTQAGFGRKNLWHPSARADEPPGVVHGVVGVGFANGKSGRAQLGCADPQSPGVTPCTACLLRRLWPSHSIAAAVAGMDDTRQTRSMGVNDPYASRE